jgi:molybdate-binding protein
VARLRRVHPQHVHRLLRRGFPRRRVGKEWRFDRDDVLAWSRVAGGAEVASRGAPPPVAANGDPAVETLLESVDGARARRGREAPVLGSVAADSGTALDLLARRLVVASGFPGREFPARLPAGRLARLHVVTREVGLACRPRPGPPRLEDLDDLGGGRIASRPPSAGTRPLLEAALRRAGADPDQVHDGARTCASPRDAVLAVLRSEADVGVTSRAWAGRAGLAFSPVAVEAYGILPFAEDLGGPGVVRLLEAAQSGALAARLRGVPGYDASETGRVVFDEEPGAGDLATRGGADRR